MNAKAEKFIQEYTSHGSNKLINGDYHEWLTPEQALRAVEIAETEPSDELIKKIVMAYKTWLTHEAQQPMTKYIKDMLKYEN